MCVRGSTSWGLGESDQLRRFFGSVSLAGEIDNGPGLDNDEQGAPILIDSLSSPGRSCGRSCDI